MPSLTRWFHHMRGEPQMMAELDIIKSALELSELPVIEITTGMPDPNVKQALIGNTTRSVEMRYSLVATTWLMSKQKSAEENNNNTQRIKDVT